MGTKRKDAARREAMSFLAAYDGRPGEDEQRVARLARTWLSMLGSRHSIQGLVQDTIQEFYDPEISGGCGWEDLRRKFTGWAISEGWLTETDIPRDPAGPKS